jgi:uncharacterized protein
MKKQLLFVQGAGGYEEDKKLVESLRENLGEGYEVKYPKMPDDDNFGHEAWKEQISKNLLDIKGEVILVGHSFGASTLLKYLSEEKPERTVAGLFLIATPYWGSEDWQKEYAFEENFAPQLPKNLKIFFYHSRDDDVVPFEHLRLYKEKLPQATFLEVERGGHQFNNDLSKVAQDIQKL